MEQQIFRAPLIELAGRDSEFFLSRAKAARAAAHTKSAEEVLGEKVGVGRTVELDSVKPLLDAHGTLNLAAVTEAVDVKLGGKTLAAGQSITLHGVPTQVTLTMPEDVTITAPNVARAEFAAGTTEELVTSQSHSVSGQGWAYSGANRPDDWGSIKKEWEMCKLGEKQVSPLLPTYVHVCITHTYLHVHTYVCACFNLCVCVFVTVCVCVRVYIYIYTSLSLSLSPYISLSMNMIYIYIYIYMYMYMYTSCISIFAPMSTLQLTRPHTYNLCSTTYSTPPYPYSPP